eukprot:2019564-Pleurochrysis_carterae.AAC.3
MLLPRKACFPDQVTPATKALSSENDHKSFTLWQHSLGILKYCAKYAQDCSGGMRASINALTLKAVDRLEAKAPFLCAEHSTSLLLTSRPGSEGKAEPEWALHGEHKADQHGT